jgi:CDP-glucose 4,6-dehydratase
MDLNPEIWKGKKVLITGHTGFKGTWLSFLLRHLGAELTGVSLPDIDNYIFYKESNARANFKSEKFIDIRDQKSIEVFMSHTEFDYVFHLAAQSLVGESIVHPLETFTTNISGTANVLFSSLTSKKILGIILVTSDKVYENTETEKPFLESDRLGGDDPYSASKAAAEILIRALSQSNNPNHIPISTVRAGNVIGGGDWARERIIPDVVRSVVEKKTLTIRFPGATRPWQHVLDCLSGYILVAENHIKKISTPNSLNFGPHTSLSVSQLVEKFVQSFEYKPRIVLEKFNTYEKKYLNVNSDLARFNLGWNPKLNTDQAIQMTAKWYSDYLKGISTNQLVVEDIRQYLGDKNEL